MRISDWSSDVCSSDLNGASEVGGLFLHPAARAGGLGLLLARSRYLFIARHRARFGDRILAELRGRSEEHTSELQSLMRISYAVFCLKKKQKTATREDYLIKKLERTEDAHTSQRTLSTA